MKDIIENLEIKKWRKRDVSNRFADIETRTVIRILNENHGDEAVLCVHALEMEDLILHQKCQTEYLFFKTYKAYLTRAEKKLIDLAHFETVASTEEMINHIAKPLSNLIALSEENGTPIGCLSEGDANMACLLAHFHVKAILVNKYWKDLPGGEMLKDKCDQEFEELCSGLKIPRRTRAIMKRKSKLSEAATVTFIPGGGENA